MHFVATFAVGIFTHHIRVNLAKIRPAQIHKILFTVFTRVKAHPRERRTTTSALTSWVQAQLKWSHTYVQDAHQEQKGTWVDTTSKV